MNRIMIKNICSTLARLGFARGGVVPPHTRPRVTEIFTVIKGTVEAGFIISNPTNSLLTKVLHEGDVFVFPQDLVHFQTRKILALIAYIFYESSTQFLGSSVNRLECYIRFSKKG